MRGVPASLPCLFPSSSVSSPGLPLPASPALPSHILKPHPIPLRQIFADNPEALCTEIVLQDSGSKVYHHYLVQDTPGGRGQGGRFRPMLQRA